MTIYEAIQHAFEIAANPSCKYVEEYSLMAAWLSEFKSFRNNEEVLRKLLQAMREYDIFKQAEAFLQQEKQE